jgi:hypothetical protein
MLGCLRFTADLSSLFGTVSLADTANLTHQTGGSCCTACLWLNPRSAGTHYSGTTSQSVTQCRDHRSRTGKSILVPNGCD